MALWAGPGCAYNSAPQGFLASPIEAQYDVWGAWIELTSESASEVVAGELIAVSDDTIWVRVLPDTLRSVPTAAVTSGHVVVYDSQHGRVALASLVGTLSTASNGVLLIVTAPLWVLAGTASTVSQSWRPVHRLPPGAWSDLALFARFPQGIPPGLDRGSLFHVSQRPVGQEAPASGTREPLLAPGPWIWMTGTAALGVGRNQSLAGVVGLNVGGGPLSIRARYVAWGAVLEHRLATEIGLLVSFRPPRPRRAYAYELALGLGRQQYQSYDPGPDDDPSYGLAFSAALAWPSPGPLGLKVEAMGSLAGTAPLVGLGLSFELGRRPVLD